VDAALCNFLPIRARRAKLGLAGNSGTAPEWYEIFLGDGKLVGETADRIQTTFDKATGKLVHRQLHHASDVVLPNGQKGRQITIDLRDKDQIPKIIQRERKRHNLPPLSDEQLAIEAQNFTAKTIERPLVMVNLEASFAYLQHAMLKIVYELAFLWLGESYLDDPLAAKLRAAVISKDLASADEYAANIFDARECKVFSDFWTPHEGHHLAYASLVAGKVIVAIRVFDLYAAGVIVSEEPDRYFRNHSDLTKLGFLAIDSVSGKTIHTPFETESRRIAEMMTAERRKPPFADPL